jgi:hypothetical protein
MIFLSARMEYRPTFLIVSAPVRFQFLILNQLPMRVKLYVFFVFVFTCPTVRAQVNVNFPPRAWFFNAIRAVMQMCL